MEALLPLIGAQTMTDMEGAMEDVQSVRHNDVRCEMEDGVVLDSRGV